MSKYYNLELRLNQYTNDKEYRETLRQLFSMQKVVAHCEEIDDITNDENDYDTDSASKAMDFIYEATKTNNVFQILYDSAAGKMLSQDREIGLAVLYSYDYMLLFHNCFVEYYNNPSDFDDKKDSFIQLSKKLF